MESTQASLRCSVGVTAYNAEVNIGPLLDALLGQHLHEVVITKIIVVASGCTDRTVSLVVQRGLQVRYAPEAIVYSAGPDSVHGFVLQRRRNDAGNLYLKSKYGYTVSSIQNTRVARFALKEILGALRLVWTLALLATLEVWSRMLGWYDFAVWQDRHVVWDMAWSQKADVAAGKDASVRQDHHRSDPQTINIEPKP